MVWLRMSMWRTSPGRGGARVISPASSAWKGVHEEALAAEELAGQAAEQAAPGGGLDADARRHADHGAGLGDYIFAALHAEYGEGVGGLVKNFVLHC